MHLKLISCEIFLSEIESAAARSHNHIEIEFLPVALHQLTPPESLRYLQHRLDEASRSQAHAVLLVAGACKRGLHGLQPRGVPLVLPRAKDCISLVLERGPTLRKGFSFFPRERGPRCRPPARMRGPGSSPETTYWMAPVYGSPEPPPACAPSASPDWHWRTRLAGVPKRTEAPRREVRSSRSLLEMLVDGYWNYKDFLVVPQGWRVVVTDDNGTIAAEKAP